MRTSILLLALTATAPLAFSQSSITGTVRDAYGMALERISVQAKNTATNATTNGVSNLDGSYTITGLAPGTYDVSSTPGGMQPFRSAGLTVGAGLRVHYRERAPPSHVAAGSCATAGREPSQGREAAALSGPIRVPQSSLAAASSDGLPALLGTTTRSDGPGPSVAAWVGEVPSVPRARPSPPQRELQSKLDGFGTPVPPNLRCAGVGLALF